MIKVDILIVLCAGNFINGEKYNNYMNIKGQKVYIGAENRMKAAVKLDNLTDKYLLVGGSKEKVSSMKDYLEANHCKTSIEKLVSGSSTCGNIIAINQYIEKNIKHKINVGILSNSYHFTRIYAFLFKYMSKYSQSKCIFIPIPSELIDDVKIDYELFNKMSDLESNGVNDLRKNKYEIKK